jgi:hypothetical protein
MFSFMVTKIIKNLKYHQKINYYLKFQMRSMIFLLKLLIISIYSIIHELLLQDF